MQTSLSFLNISFGYDTASQPLFNDLTVRFPTGWSGIVGANGAGKSTLLRLAVGELTPLAGTIERPPESAYCPQRTDVSPKELHLFLQADNPHACRLRGQLGLEPDWAERWNTLSHGERKRAQIALALWRRPVVLALDEPSNHIDANAREKLLQALRQFRGIGLIVSHDRQLLDGLCRQCLFLEHGQAELRRGGYTQGKAQGQAAVDQLRLQRERAKEKHLKIEREMTVRRERTDKEHQLRSKSKLVRGDHDSRAKIDRARISDSKRGSSLRQLQGRIDQAAKDLASIRIIKEEKTGIWIPNSRSMRDRLFQLDADLLPLGSDGRALEFPELTMPPDGRIALLGPNGAGKSTLLRHIVQHLNLPEERVLYIPQEITATESQRILDDVRSLNHDALGRVLNIVSHLGSNVQPVLETELPSPGEIRKILLALGIVRDCHLILLDEPTNHLDLPSIESLEKALIECPCGLLLVSHDHLFLKRLTTQRWQIEQADEHRMQLKIINNW